MTKTSRIACESGQSTIEFALTLVLILGFALAYIQVSLVFAYGNYVQYATFMSARAQLAASSDRSDQLKRAQDVLVRMLKKSEGQPGVDRWPGIARAVGGSEVKGAAFGNGPGYSSDSTQSWMQGVRYTFRSRIFMIPIGGDASANRLTLTSESWLGMEPSYEECAGSLGNASFDNGC